MWKTKFGTQIPLSLLPRIQLGRVIRMLIRRHSNMELNPQSRGFHFYQTVITLVLKRKQLSFQVSTRDPKHSCFKLRIYVSVLCDFFFAQIAKKNLIFVCSYFSF